MLHQDYSNSPALHFEGFIDQLHESMMAELLRLNSKLGGKLLDPFVVRDVLLAENAEEHLFIYLKDVVYSILNDSDPLFLEGEAISSLTSLNELIVKVEAYEFFNGDLYLQIVKLLSKGLKVSLTEACIRLFVSVGKRIEHEHRD